MRGITGIYYVEDLGSTPARVNRYTGICLINLRMWKHIKPAHRFFILLHELGHVILNTKNELTADRWAFQQYADRGYSLSESIFALSSILTFRSPEHYWRVYLQLERAKEYDYSINGNQQVYQH